MIAKTKGKRDKGRLQPTSYPPLLKVGFLANYCMNYKHALVKVDGPVATLFCNGCGVELLQSSKHEDRQHFCTMCMSGNCKAKFKHEQ